MVETLKPVRISPFWLKQITKGLEKEMYETLFKPILEVLNGNNTVINSTVENFNPYHDREGKFCSKNKAIEALTSDIKPVKIKSSDIPKFGKRNHKGIRNYVIEAFRQVKEVRIKGNSRTVTFTKDGAKRTSQKQSPADIKQNAFYTKIKEIVERAKYFNFEPADERHLNIKGQEIYYSRFNIDNEEYRVKISVDVPLDKYLELGANYNFAGHRVKRIEIAPARIKVSVDNQHSLAETDAIHIITYYYGDFNPPVNNSICNDKYVLVEAIQSGRVYYENGAFKAADKFSNAVAAELEKLGAKFKYGAYYIPRSMLPLEIENTIALVAAREAAKIAALDALLLRMSETLGKDTLTQLFIEKSVEKMFANLQRNLEESTQESKIPVIDISVEMPDFDVPDSFYEQADEFYSFDESYDKKTGKKGSKGKKGNKKGKDGSGGGTGGTDTNTDNNPPVLSFDDYKIDKRTQKIAKDYTYNMNYWVKNWKAKEIVKMRRTVLDMVQKGQRTEAIAKYFEKRWGIAKNKAAFLARNESSIASSVLKATHYQEMGCSHFMWLRSISKEKRELHLEYAKETGNQYGIGGINIFAFDNPPIIEQVEIKLKSGEKQALPKPDGKRGLPGQTYNCECDLVGIKNIQYYINQRRIQNAKRNIFTKIKYNIENSLQRNNNHWRYRRFGEGEAV